MRSDSVILVLALLMATVAHGVSRSRCRVIGAKHRGVHQASLRIHNGCVSSASLRSARFGHGVSIRIPALVAPRRCRRMTNHLLHGIDPTQDVS